MPNPSGRRPESSEDQPKKPLEAQQHTPPTEEQPSDALSHEDADLNATPAKDLAEDLPSPTAEPEVNTDPILSTDIQTKRTDTSEYPASTFTEEPQWDQQGSGAWDYNQYVEQEHYEQYRRLTAPLTHSRPLERPEAQEQLVTSLQKNQTGIIWLAAAFFVVLLFACIIFALLSSSASY